MPLEEAYGLTAAAVRELMALLKRVKYRGLLKQYDGVPETPRKAVAPVCVVWVRPTSTTPTSGRYPCVWTYYDSNGASWNDDSNSGWVVFADGHAPKDTTTHYLATPLAPITATGVAVFLTSSAAAGSSTVDDIANLADPNADSLLFWDDSAGHLVYLTLGTGLSITGTTIDATGGGGGKDISYFRQVGTSPLERWYSPAINQSATGTAYTPVANTLVALPFVAPRGGTLDRLGVRAQLVSGTTKCRLGVYSATGETNLYPSAKLVDGGELTIADGVNTATISQALTAGTLYWLVYLVDSVTMLTFSSLPAAAIPPVLGMASDLDTPGTGLTVAQAYGALPSSYPASATLLTSVVPALSVRYSA